MGGYWCPENEYQNLIKISCHGCFGETIDANARDSNCVDKRTKCIDLTKKLIKKVFMDAIDIEDGPAIEETCTYTVRLIKIK
jgi:hypothetical protein